MSKKHKKKHGTLITSEAEVATNEGNENAIITEESVQPLENIENADSAVDVNVEDNPIESEENLSIPSNFDDCSAENTESEKNDAESTSERENDNGENSVTEENIQEDLSAVQEDESSEVLNVSEENVTDGEIVENPENGAESESNSESEEELRKKEEKEKAKKERREKRRAWVKAHKLFIAISCIILLVAIGILVGHFVSTANMIFIHDADDLIKASLQSKKSELKFKSDVTIDEDITLTGYKLDLDKYTLTVNGNLTIKNEKVYIGKQKFLWSDFEKGGKLDVSGRLILDSKETQLQCSVVADNIVILGEKVHILNTIEPKTADYADVWFNRNETTDTVLGGYSSDAGHIFIDSQTQSNVHTNATSTITLNGKVNEISGGEKVYLKDNSKSAFVRECSKLYISEHAVWSGFDGNSVQNHYFVQKLATPELIIEKTSTGFELHISHIDNADAYIVNYEGLEEVKVGKEYNANYTTYILPTRDPSSYKLSVYAVSNNPDEFNDGDIATTIVEVYSTLDKPQILSCEKVESESGEQYILTIESVKNALSYEINVDGKTINANANGESTITVDLSSLINGVGTYNIRVTALAKGTNYKDSQVELYSFVNTIKLSLGEISESEKDGKFVYSWERVSGAMAYEIVYGEEGKKIISTENMITFDDKTMLSVRPLGKGYYKDGDTVSINLPEIDPENPDDNENPIDNDNQ